MKKGRVALVVPPFLGGRYFLQPPLGLLWSARYLDINSVESDLFDLRLLDGTFNVEQLKDYAFIVVCTSEIDILQNYPVDYRLQYCLGFCRRIKEVTDAKLIVVGAHSSVAPELVLAETNCDFVICGEWELSICDIIKDNPQEKVVLGRKGFFDYNILPKFELIDFNRYYGYLINSNDNVLIKNWSIIQGTRGCAFDCCYCFNFYGKDLQVRSAESIYMELKFQSELGAKNIFFVDSIFGINKDQTQKLCDLLIRNPLPLRLLCQTRANVLDSEVLKMMEMAGFCGIWIGIESFNDNVLKIVNKCITAKENKKILDEISKAGISPGAFMMQGLPLQSADSVSSDLEYLKANKIRYNLSALLLRPGSRLYNELCEDDEISNWHNILLFKGKSLFGDSAVAMAKLHKNYSRKRIKNTFLLNSELKVFKIVNEDSLDCYKFINIFENNKNTKKAIIISDNFFKILFFEEIVKYLSDSAVEIEIWTFVQDVDKHEAVLSTLKGNVNFLQIVGDPSNIKESDSLLKDLNIYLGEIEKSECEKFIFQKRNSAEIIEV